MPKPSQSRKLWQRLTSIIAEHKKRKAIRAAFSRYLTPGAIDALARDKQTLSPLYQVGWLSCLLVQVRDETPEALRSRAMQSIPICLNNGAVIMDMMASIQLIAFGLPFGALHQDVVEDLKHKRRATSEQLLVSLGGDVRVVAFEGDMTVGNIGTDQRFSYTILVPRFDRFLAELIGTEFGTISEAPPV